jgi:hypothetical protein
MLSDFIETDMGQVQVEHGDGRVRVTFHANSPSSVTYGHDVNSMTVMPRPKVPSAHDEVTQNGSTFEVLDVRESGDGYDLLNGNTRAWEKWVED